MLAILQLLDEDVWTLDPRLRCASDVSRSWDVCVSISWASQTPAAELRNTVVAFNCHQQSTLKLARNAVLFEAIGKSDKNFIWRHQSDVFIPF